MRYLLAIFVSSVCFGLLFCLPIIIAVWSQVSNEIIISDIVMMALVALFTAILATTFAAPLAHIFQFLARLFGLSSYAYWIATGILSGMAIASLVVVGVHEYFGPIGDDGLEVTLASQWVKFGPDAAVSGGLGGFIYWWLGKKFNRERKF